MHLGHFNRVHNIVPKNVSLLAMEEGEQFRMLNKHGKAEGGRWTMIDNSTGKCIAEDPKGVHHDLLHMKYRQVKPCHVVTLTVAAKLKGMNPA